MKKQIYRPQLGGGRQPSAGHLWVSSASGEELAGLLCEFDDEVLVHVRKTFGVRNCIKSGQNKILYNNNFVNMH